MASRVSTTLTYKTAEELESVELPALKKQAPIESSETTLAELIKIKTLGDDEEKKDSSEIIEGEEVPWTYPEGGMQAYGVVFACMMFSGVCMGYGLLFGSWLLELHTRIYPDVPLSTLAYIGGLANFATTSTSFLAGRAGDTYGYKPVLAVGSALSILAMVLSAFTFQNLPLLFVFQGFILGSCLGISMPIFLSLPSQFFLKRRGVATGVAASGSGFFGGLASLLIRVLVGKIGYRYSMLAYAGINAAVYIAAYSLVEVRLPPLKPGESRVAKNWLPKGCWKDIRFYSLSASIGIGIWGYLSPFYYISTYTIATVPSIQAGSIYIVLPLVLSNFAGGFGRILAGLLADIIGPVNSLILSFLLGGLFQMVIWPAAKTYGGIIAFAISYGVVASPFLSLLPVAASRLFGLKGLSTLVGFIILLNSPGQLVGTSVSGMILTQTGNDYAKMSYYSGAMMVIGALALLPARLSMDRSLWAKV